MKEVDTLKKEIDEIFEERRRARKGDVVKSVRDRLNFRIRNFTNNSKFKSRSRSASNFARDLLKTLASKFDQHEVDPLANVQLEGNSIADAFSHLRKEINSRLTLDENIKNFLKHRKKQVDREYPQDLFIAIIHACDEMPNNPIFERFHLDGFELAERVENFVEDIHIENKKKGLACNCNACIGRRMLQIDPRDIEEDIERIVFEAAENPENLGDQSQKGWMFDHLSAQLGDLATHVETCLTPNGSTVVKTEPPTILKSESQLIPIMLESHNLRQCQTVLLQEGEEIILKEYVDDEEAESDYNGPFSKTGERKRLPGSPVKQASTTMGSNKKTMSGVLARKQVDIGRLVPMREPLATGHGKLFFFVEATEDDQQLEPMPEYMGEDEELDVITSWTYSQSALEEGERAVPKNSSSSSIAYDSLMQSSEESSYDKFLRGVESGTTIISGATSGGESSGMSVGFETYLVEL